MDSILVLGVAGGSCSGKTTLTHFLKNHFGEKATVLAQDSFYIDQSQKFDRDGGSVNFDHPSSIDFSLMGECISALKKNLEVSIPIYDFATHMRSETVQKVSPSKLVVIDGTLILSQDLVRTHLDVSFFIDAPEEIRFKRRLERDTKERGRTEQGVRDQFFNQVKPMHDEWVEPSKVQATHVFPGTTSFSTNSDLEAILEKIKKDLLL